MIGIFSMHAMGLVKLHVKPTRYAANMLKIGNRGRIMLPDLIGMRVSVFLVILVALLVSSLFMLQRLTP